MRRAVTLIELLITMTIMAIIAAAILGTASSAIEKSRETRTISMITKLNSLVSDWVSTYETRRIELNADIEAALAGIQDPRVRGKAVADMRLLGLRELMKMEMPDRWTDVAQPPQVLKNRAGLSASYNARYLGSKPSTNHQGAECLYMFVMRATGDGEAPSMFNADQIQDTDGDGFNEFIDGWGNPISWLRWPTGIAPTNLMSGNAETDHDPFDVYVRDVAKTARLANHFHRPSNPPYPAVVLKELGTMESRDGGAFRIVPLIFSIGPDEQQGITSKDDAFVADLDPYTATEPVINNDDAGLLPGTLKAEGAADNIDSHRIDY